jgi:hypothetical protein
MAVPFRKALMQAVSRTAIISPVFLKNTCMYLPNIFVQRNKLFIFHQSPNRKAAAAKFKLLFSRNDLQKLKLNAMI